MVLNLGSIKPQGFSVSFSGVQWRLRSLNFKRARFNCNSSEQQCSQPFWCHQIVVYNLIDKEALEILIAFVGISVSRPFQGWETWKERKDILWKWYYSGSCQGETVHFWNCLWKVTAKVSLICSKYSLSYVFFCVKVMFCSFCSWKKVILCATDACFICALIKYIPIFWRNHILFFQLQRVWQMHGLNLQGSIPPTRLRTTAVAIVCFYRAELLN